jgi:hypothetical protein
VSDFIAPSAQVRLRFVAEDAGTGSVVEAALDDFSIDTLLCNPAVTPFCFGDGSGSACPCANLGGPGVGCANSTGNGAGLSGSGVAQVSADTLSLAVAGVPPTSTVIFFQGTQQDNGGLGIAFYDGLRCVSGTAIRLGVKTSSAGGGASYPELGDNPISIQGLVPGGGATLYYQAHYRDPAIFCTVDTSNYSNGVTAVWVP